VGAAGKKEVKHGGRRVKGSLVNTPVSGPEGRLPEGGEGMRYVLDKTIRLAAGPHHVVFGVPYDDYYIR